MRAIKKTPLIAKQIDKNKAKMDEIEGAKEIENTELKIELCSAFVKQYELTRCMRKLQRAEQGQMDPLMARPLSRLDTMKDNDSNDSNEMNEESNANNKQWSRKKALTFKRELIEAKKKAIEIDKWIEGN